MMLRDGSLGAAVLCVSVFGGLGCGNDYLTPEEVRAHILLPRGAISEDTVGRVTDDFMKKQKADGIEGFANLMKSSEGGNASASAWAAGMVDEGDMGAMELAVSYGAAEDVADIFCAASLVAAIAAFDSCEADARECEAKLTIDSCVMRIGENGDRNARGRMVFKVKTTKGDGWSRGQLSLAFEDFESTNPNGNMDYIGGLIAVETTEMPGFEEVIFTADLESQERTLERGLFDDGILSHERVTAAARFTFQESENSTAGTLEIVAFVDEDGERNDSVVIAFEAESRRIDESTELAGATLSVRGSNGSFTCTWEGAAEQRDAATSSYESSGSCVDEDTGETFDWDSSYEIREDV